MRRKSKLANFHAVLLACFVVAFFPVFFLFATLRNAIVIFFFFDRSIFMVRFGGLQLVGTRNVSQNAHIQRYAVFRAFGR